MSSTCFFFNKLWAIFGLFILLGNCQGLGLNEHGDASLRERTWSPSKASRKGKQIVIEVPNESERVFLDRSIRK